MNKPKVDWMDGQKFEKDGLVELVIDHAHQMYEHEGWDFVVETVTREEIRQILENSRCQTKWGACQAVKAALCLSTLDSVRGEQIAMSKWGL